MQSPSVGRVVHYLHEVNVSGLLSLVSLAAIVTAVHSDTCVDLTVCATSACEDLGRAGGTFGVMSATLGEEKTNWKWPPFVGAPPTARGADPAIAALTARVTELEQHLAKMAAAAAAPEPDEPEITVTHDAAPIATPAAAPATEPAKP